MEAMLKLVGWGSIMAGAGLVFYNCVRLFDIDRRIRPVFDWIREKMNAIGESLTLEDHGMAEEGVPLKRDDLALPRDRRRGIDIHKFARLIVQNLFIECHPERWSDSGPEALFDPDEDPGVQIQSIDELEQKGWIRVFLNSLLKSKVDNRWTQTSLYNEIKSIVETADNHFADPHTLASDFDPVISFYFEAPDGKEIDPGAFSLELLPIIGPGRATLDCEGYLYLAPKRGEIRTPGLSDCNLRFGKKTFKSKGSYPLCDELGKKVAMGSQKWHPVRTVKECFDGNLVFTWEKTTDEIDKVARIGVLEYQGPNDLFLKERGKTDLKPMFEEGAVYELTASEAAHTQVSLVRKVDSRELSVAFLVFKNREPELDVLDQEDCRVIDDTAFVNEIFRSKENVLRFLATTIFSATHLRKDPLNKEDAFLDSQPEQFYDDEGFYENRFRGMAPQVHGRLRVVASEENHARLGGMVGVEMNKRITAETIAMINENKLSPFICLYTAKVKQKLSNDGVAPASLILLEDVLARRSIDSKSTVYRFENSDDFKQALDGAGVKEPELSKIEKHILNPYRTAFSGFKKMLEGENELNFDIKFYSDNYLGDGDLLVRSIPIEDVKHKKLVYGHVDVSKCKNVQDISGTSFDDDKAFLVSQSSNTWPSIRLSRFPLFGLRAPQVMGVIGIALEWGSTQKQLKIFNRSSSEIFVDGEPLDVRNDMSVPIADLPTPRDDWKSLTVETSEKPVCKFQVNVYDEAKELQSEDDFMPRPGRIEFGGIALTRRVERSGWEASTKFKPLWEKTNLPPDSLKGVVQITNSSFGAIVDQNTEKLAIFAGIDVRLFFKDGSSLHLSPGENTLEKNIDLSNKEEFDIIEDDQIKVKYMFRDPMKAQNADTLIGNFGDKYDFEDSLMEEFGTELNDEDVVRADLLRCDPSESQRNSGHLYYALTKHAGEIRGWLLRKGGGIEKVYRDRDAIPVHEDANRNLEVVGPLRQGSFFLVKTNFEDALIPFSFDIEDQRTQIEKYLKWGFFTRSDKITYFEGGVISDDIGPGSGTQQALPTPPPQPAKPPQSFVMPSDLKNSAFFFKDEGGSNKLAFNPRRYSIFFDKHSYGIGYSRDRGGYTLFSRHHKEGDVTPKTVFMVIPASGEAILGSHALPEVILGKGKNQIVLPGETFDFDYGRRYYQW